MSDDRTPASNLQFAADARRLTAVCRRLGLPSVSFRSPPRVIGVDRTLRRRPDGSCVVAVRVKNRTVADVRVDLIAGVVAANASLDADMLSALETALAREMLAAAA